MSSISSAVLIASLMVVSVPAAQAGNNPAFEILPANPTPPTPAASEPPSAAVSEAPKPMRQRLTRAERRETRRQAALQRRAAKLAMKKLPASAAVASAPPAAMEGATEKPAPTPSAPEIASTDSPHDAVTPPSLTELIAKHAVENGIPVKLAQAVVTIESRGNPRATNHGALGLMQIKYGTARAAGFGGVATGLLVAETNLRFGMKVLADAYRSAGGDICGALMRYQSGHLATHPNRANRAYCSKARSLMAGA